MVGIFWGVPTPVGMVLPTEATPLARAESYSDRLTHANGDAEAWAAWQALGGAGLARRGLPAAIAWREYDELPRGRVVADSRNGSMLCMPIPH